MRRLRRRRQLISRASAPEARKSCSPGRKPWERMKIKTSPEGAPELFEQDVSAGGAKEL
jgi:hypothetical protein